LYYSRGIERKANIASFAYYYLLLNFPRAIPLSSLRGMIMGKRDYRWREAKKIKKGAKKIGGANILPSPSTVEVIKKRRKERPAEE
jgi:hypothetical protein